MKRLFLDTYILIDYIDNRAGAATIGKWYPYV